MKQHYTIFDLTRPEIEAVLASGVDTAVATFGSTEQHGLHLPMGTDSIWGEELGARVTQGLGNALQVPGLRIGCSEHHMEFVGSLTLSLETFCAVVEDTCASLVRHGFQHIVLLPTHGGNFQPIKQVAEQIRAKFPQTNIIDYSDVFAFMDVLFTVGARYGFTPEYSGGHAGENETSIILALRPELVNMDVAEAGFIGPMTGTFEKIMAEGFKAVTENGVLGNPNGARADIGEAYLDAITEDVIRFVKEKRGM